MWRLPRFPSSLAGKVAVAILWEILRCSCLLGCSVQLSFGVATLRICIRPRRPLVSGVKRVGRAMRPTCSLAVDQDLETHCAGLARVSMILVADTADGHTASMHRISSELVDGALHGRRRLLSLPGEQCWFEGFESSLRHCRLWHFGLHDKPEHSVSTGDGSCSCCRGHPLTLQGNC